MKRANHSQVTPRQATAIIINTIISGKLLILPRVLTATTGTSSWIALIVSSLLALALVSIYTTLGRRFQNSSLPQYCVQTLGSFFGGALALLLAAVWLVLAALASRLFSTVIVTSALPRVPLESGILTMLLISAHLATQDVKTVARVQELFLPFIIGTIFAVIIPSLVRINIWRLLPIVQFDNIRMVGYSVLTALGSFWGFEIVSLFMPFYTHLGKAGRSHNIGIIIVAGMYLLIVIASIGLFGIAELRRTQWPTLELVRVIGFRGLFERLEAPFLAIYVIVIFTTIGSLLFGVVSTLSDLFNIKSRLTWPYFLVIPAYYIAIRPQNVVELERIIHLILLIHQGIVLAVPLLVLPIAVIRGKEDKSNEGETAGS